MSGTLDVTAMYLAHDALRRELELLARTAARIDDDPRRILGTTAGLTGHLEHEEEEALPLIQAIVTEQQWQHFGQVNARLVGPDAPRILPWMLDGASAQITATMLAPLPEPARLAYRNEWQPAYAALDRWGAGTAG